MVFLKVKLKIRFNHFYILQSQVAWINGVKEATQNICIAAGTRSDEFFVPCPMQSHYTASQFWPHGLHSLLKTDGLESWKWGGTWCRTAAVQLGEGWTSHRQWGILTTLIKHVVCKTSIPGKGLLKNQGLRKIFLRSERSKTFCCHFSIFTRDLNCVEGLKSE